jgi:hypothetical protein
MSKCTTFDLLLTAQTPVSHHDAAVQDDSNRMLFNRQKQIVRRTIPSDIIGQEWVNRIVNQEPVPLGLKELFDGLSFPEFVSVCIAHRFITIYNGLDGTGLFEGMQRYERLETRLRMAAISATTLHNLWDRLCTTLVVPVHPGKEDRPLLTLLSLPIGLQQMVLKSIVTDYRSIVALARLWADTVKQLNPKYAEKAGMEPLLAQADAPEVHLWYDAIQIVPTSDDVQVLEVPVVSANSLRHQLVREPAWQHLCWALGLNPAQPGQGPVPAGVEAIFYNGGNLVKGVTEPSGAFTFTQQIKAAYPSLDLLGGCTNSFTLGESKLRMAGWLVCSENREALRGTSAYDLPNARMSIYDMMDDVTLTRQAGTNGTGQMIFSFETLAAGVQIFTRFSLAPFAPDLTKGALLAAVDWFLQNDNTVGGSAARGFGHCVGEWISAVDPCTTLYEDYLAANREALIEGMVTGKMGTSTKVLS